MDIKEISILGSEINNHWYYHSKARAIKHFLNNARLEKILDVGAGSGFFSHYLLQHTHAMQACCVDTSYENEHDVSKAGKLIHYRRSVDVIDADLILMMDVLEHVDNDLAFLKQYVDKAPAGSQFLITVPAFQFLWSRHDDFLEHKRRYTLKQLETVVKHADLEIKQSAYYFGLVFPIAAISRIAQTVVGNKTIAPRSQLTNHQPIVNRLLKSLCAIELFFMRLNRFAGLTVVCLAEKH